MIKLRPHHLLCTQGYSGKGYDLNFVSNMNRIVKEIREDGANVELVFSTDDICGSCPNMLGVNKCITNEKVVTIDKKAVDYFDLKEGIYNYSEIVRFIKDNVTTEILKDICTGCEWYAVSSCRKNICGE